jgi:hypothetical protein
MQGILVGTERERERENKLCNKIMTINVKYLLQKHEFFIRILFIVEYLFHILIFHRILVINF